MLLDKCFTTAGFFLRHAFRILLIELLVTFFRRIEGLNDLNLRHDRLVELFTLL